MKRHRKRKQVDPWEVRRASLEALGFASYAEYLSSALWAKIRARVFARKGRGCSFCEGAAVEIHHNDYRLRTMQGKNTNPLLPVCAACHAQGSKSAGGWVLRPETATRRMRRLSGKAKPRPLAPKRKRRRSKKRWKDLSDPEQLAIKKARHDRKAARMAKQGKTLPSYEEHQAWNQKKIDRKKAQRARDIAECERTLREYERLKNVGA